VPTGIAIGAVCLPAWGAACIARVQRLSEAEAWPIRLHARSWPR
jgi:hypothetical protein